MASFEGIVRPFETRKVTPAQAVPQSDGSPPSNTKISIGGGSATTFTGEYTLQAQWYMTKQVKEVQVNR